MLYVDGSLSLDTEIVPVTRLSFAQKLLQAHIYNSCNIMQQNILPRHLIVNKMLILPYTWSKFDHSNFILQISDLAQLLANLIVN